MRKEKKSEKETRTKIAAHCPRDRSVIAKKPVERRLTEREKERDEERGAPRVSLPIYLSGRTRRVYFSELSRVDRDHTQPREHTYT